jgi:hypothetical protein
VSERVCKACGEPLPPNKAQGRLRVWCSDRCRKTQYRGVCIDCGAPTDGSNGPGKSSKRCMRCFRVWHLDNFKIWDADRVIVAIQAWADEHGGVPPTAMAWNPSMARAKGRRDLADKFEADQAWPLTSTVLRYCGSWNAAIRAAGFSPHQGIGTADDFERTRRLHEDGLSVAEIAEREERTPSNIRWRLRRMGIQPADARARYTAEERQHVIDAYLAGATIEQAGAVLGVSSATAWTWLHEAGMTKTQRGLRKAAA